MGSGVHIPCNIWKSERNWVKKSQCGAVEQKTLLRGLYLRIAAIKKLIAVKTFCLEKTTFGFLPQIMESVLISFFAIFQKISFFHNYCGELLCLVSRHLCLLCHFYVVYELFIFCE